VSIGSELSGTVLRVHVDVNDRVTKGQVLLELDTAKLRDQILRSQAGVAAARSRSLLTAATVAEAGASLARLEAVARLSGGQVPSVAELDAGRAVLARAQAEAGSARAGVDEALATLSTDQINLSKASITAPSDGVVLTRSVDPGNAVAASLQAVTLFTVAEDLARLRLWVYVDEADVGVVKAGQAASFTVSAYPTRPCATRPPARRPTPRRASPRAWPSGRPRPRASARAQPTAPAPPGRARSGCWPPPPTASRCPTPCPGPWP
jgi:HlyD family secretion protein